MRRVGAFVCQAVSGPRTRAHAQVSVSQSHYVDAPRLWHFLLNVRISVERVEHMMYACAHAAEFGPWFTPLVFAKLISMGFLTATGLA